MTDVTTSTTSDATASTTSAAATPRGLTEETRAAAQEIIARYPEGRSRSALLPMLHLVQAEEGYVTPAGIAFCAEVLGLTKAEVGAVATFYTMYKRRPTGEYLVSVCTNLSCQILGGEEIYARLSRRLGVGHDETTPDGLVTLEHAECLAACDYAPVVTVNYEFFDNQTPETAEELIDLLHRGERPTPVRGAQVCSFKEISRQLAGFRDPRPEAALAGLSHPDAPTPVDSTGTEQLVGTDIGPAPEAVEYGVAGGITERVLSDADAAKTYGEPGTVDAGVVSESAAGGEKTAHTTLDGDTDPNLRAVRADEAAQKDREL
ncbi:MAG TPA: NADH-quinone oxidoreductase subunit NuoE [Frankiaceae bacterium]|nr:NADH-quinone oxidoreductase subunit NuoE [Frankiaceae bacterium]